MDGTATVEREKFSENSAEETRTEQLKKRLESLFREVAEVEVELSRADGTIRGVPHYSLIEERAHQLGQRLSREVQQRQMGEVLASQSLTAKCPTCGIRCELESCQRDVKAVDGLLKLQELDGYCTCCRRSFFPPAGDVGV